MPLETGCEGQVTLIHFTAHKARQCTGVWVLSTADFRVHSALRFSVIRNTHKEHRDNEINAEAKTMPVLGSEG